MREKRGGLFYLKCVFVLMAIITSRYILIKFLTRPKEEEVSFIICCVSTYLILMYKE